MYLRSYKWQFENSLYFADLLMHFFFSNISSKSHTHMYEYIGSDYMNPFRLYFDFNTFDFHLKVAI